MPTASAFIISEQTGQGREVRLAGRALPHRPITFEGSQRVETTWYAGSPVGSMQVLGPQEAPSTFTGEWKDKFIVSTNPDTGRTVNPDGVAQVNGVQTADAFTLCSVMDDIRRGGQEVQVRWDEITRNGVLTRFKHTYDRRQDIQWEMEFTWFSQGEANTPVAFQQEVDRQALGSKLQNSLAQLQALVTAPFAVVDSFANVAAQAVQDFSDAAQDVASTTQSVINTITQPIDAARRSLAALTSAADALDRIRDAITMQPARALYNGVDEAEVDYGQTLAAEDYTRRLASQARDTRYDLAGQALELQDRSGQQDILAVVAARDGQDLRDIANTYYGTQQQWRQLAQYNGLLTSALTAGTMVVVPSLRREDS